jgi:S-DNA-T family DNA segregation ATPase FtsK/SpoIIIE
VLATPDITRRARVMLRLAERDPFTDLHPAPPRAPGSASVTERVVIGRRIDGGELAVPLLGVHAVVVGSSGSGKSTTLLALGDAVTACTDALAWDLDPAGVGLDALGDAVDRRERDMPGIEAALADALAIAEARPRMFAGHGMRNAWEPAPDKAALVVFVDEYPRLSTKAKELAVHLLRIGRKSRVTLILAATEATTDALGAAVAESTGLQIMHSCRHGDVRLVFGPQRIAEGWRPDRLHPATADDPGQAGQCYVATAGHREPLVSKIAPRDDTGARHTAQPTAGRHAAGRARLDSASWQAARTRPATGHRSPGGAGGREDTGDPAGADRYVITDVLACFGPDARLWTEELLARLADRDPDSYTAWSADDLATALRPLGIGPIQIKRAGANRRGYDRDTITAAWQAQHDGDRP